MSLSYLHHLLTISMFPVEKNSEAEMQPLFLIAARLTGPVGSYVCTHIFQYAFITSCLVSPVSITFDFCGTRYEYHLFS